MDRMDRRAFGKYTLIIYCERSLVSRKATQVTRCIGWTSPVLVFRFPWPLTSHPEAASKVELRGSLSTNPWVPDHSLVYYPHNQICVLNMNGARVSPPGQLYNIQSSLSRQGLHTSMWPGWRILRIWSNRVFEWLLIRILSHRFPTPLILPILSMNRGKRHGPSY